MDTIIRQCVGIDIAKDSFTACTCTQRADGSLAHSGAAEFENAKRGYNQFLKWSRKHCSPTAPAIFVMEATGIYYEPLAYHLHRLGQYVCVVLPNKVKHYAKSLNVKSKTDALDARVIAQMGAERALPAWEPPAQVFREMRALTRLCSGLKQQRTVFASQLHSIEAGEQPMALVVKSLKSIVAKLDSEIGKTEAALRALVDREEWLREKVERLLTVKGVGFLTVAVVLAETQGFKLIGSAKQLASYAGYDVVLRESGTSVRGRTRISKKGNGRIRAAMHFPALTAARHNPEFAATYKSINNGKASKMVGATALQRKLLLLLYTLWKNDSVYKNREEREKETSGEREAKPFLRLGGEAAAKKSGRPAGLPEQDELPSDRSAEALLRLQQIT